MANPEGTFVLKPDLQDAVTRRHIVMLGTAIDALVEAHDQPERLKLELTDALEENRHFTHGGILTQRGFTPELTLGREGSKYLFQAVLLDPDRYTAAIIANDVIASYSLPRQSASIKSVNRTFTPPFDAGVRRPGSHELRASAAIASVARATQRLSREFTEVQWLTS